MHTDIVLPPKEELKELNTINYPRRLRVGVPGSPRPPIYNNMEPGKLAGISADYLAALQRMLDVELQIIPYATPAEAIQALRNQQLDMLAFYNPHLHGTEGIIATPPWLLDRPIIAQKDRALVNLNSALQPVLAWAEAPEFSPQLERYFPNARLKHYRDAELALGAVAFGQADAMWGSAASIEFMRRYGYSARINLSASRSIPDMNLSFGVAATQPQLAKAINIALQHIPLAGRLRIATNWGIDSTFVLKANPLMLNAKDEIWLRQHPVIPVVPNWTVAPLLMINDDNQPTGIEAELLQLISERTGVKFAYPKPYAARDNNILALRLAELEPERPDPNLIYSRPYIVTPWVLVQKNNDDPAWSLSTQPEKKLALEKRSPMHEWVQQRYPGHNIRLVENAQQAFELVAKGEVDAIIQPKLIADYQLNNHYAGHLKISRTLGDKPARFVMATQPENLELMHIIDKALLDISRETQEKIVLHWQNAHHVDNNNYWQYYRSTIIKITLGIGLLTLLVLLWNRHLQRIIRERTRAEQTLKNQLTFTNTLFDESPVVMYVRDRQMRLLHCNKAYVDFLHIPREQLLGTALDALPAGFATEPNFQEIYEQTFLEGKPLVQDLKLHYQGRDYYTLHWALPYHDHADNIVGIIGGWLDITERYELLTALEKAKEEADRANEFKSRFLANTSHDIRTQLHAIIGLLELEMRRSQQSLGPNISAAYESATALQNLIGNVLDLSKIESGIFEPEPTPTNLVTIVEQLFTLFHSKAEARGLAFYKLIRVEHPCVLIDATMFNQIVANLVSNALKFTHAGNVEIALYQQPDAAELANKRGSYILKVSDTGCGISPHELHKIFDPFVQAGDRQSQQAGTGLGLSICRHLAHLLGGEISVESESGAGSVFTFSFHAPLCEETTAASVTNGQHGDSNVRRILIVEDHAPNRLLLAQQLKYLGHQVIETERASQALARWEQQRSTIDLIITDCNIPDMDGFTFTRTLRQREAELGLQPVPIVGLTASAEKTIQQRCVDAGMNCCLFKPANIETLNSFISTSIPPSAPPVPGNGLLEQLIDADPEACARLIESAIDSHRQLVAQLQQCQQHADIVTLAHTLKGGARLLNVGRLEKLCEQLENSESDDAQLDELRQDIVNEVQVLEATLLARLRSLNLP
ncbi:ATP-binding protein [Mixta theicola]|uniref:ATP-binding protein n=1 Tax=Mixta theicola TaxID=1458355 RepID=UPI0013FD5071|nr:transporter substrate-binding domain-containing protein [Mixta theicola]GLR08159.1 virulence sensor protein BvgS [Mixta theicola]